MNAIRRIDLFRVCFINSNDAKRFRKRRSTVGSERRERGGSRNIGKPPFAETAGNKFSSGAGSEFQMNCRANREGGREKMFRVLTNEGCSCVLCRQREGERERGERGLSGWENRTSEQTKKGARHYANIESRK